MSAVPRKVYDSDVIHQPALAALAEVYARQYVGSFEFMINMKGIVLSHGSLPQGYVRQVLNCLRQDPLQPSMQDAVNALLVPLATVAYTKPKKIEKKKERPTILWLDARCKKSYGTTETRASKPVVHIMQEFGNTKWWLQKDGTRKPEFGFNTICGGYKNIGRLWNEPPSMAEAWPKKDGSTDPLPLCATCRRLTEEQEEGS